MNTRVAQTVLLSLGLPLPNEGTQPASAIRPVALRTEYLVNPQAIDARIPRLSWIIDAGTALGAYELHINGQRVGDHVLAPEFTDYRTRTQYQTFDVTSMLHAGENVIAALLGDGWYAGGIGLSQALLGKARSIYGDHPRFLAQLEIAGAGGGDRIVTDGSWRVTREGPIRSSDILNGESYDA